MRVKETKILPCPFCGAPGDIVWHLMGIAFAQFFIACTKCNAQGFKSPNKAYAIKKWNKRVK